MASPTNEDSRLGPFNVVVLDPARAADWERVRGERRLPVLDDSVAEALLPGIGLQWVYMVDLDRLTPAERGRLVDVLAERFALPRADVERDLDVEGCPVLARDTTLFVRGRVAEPQRRQHSGAIDVRMLLP